MTDNTSNTAADWLAKEARRRGLIAEARPVNKQTLFDALAAAGLTYVTVSFDGSCDSGQIESIDARAGAEPVDLPPGKIELARPDEKGGDLQRTTHTVQDAIETLAYDLLEEEHDGWEINDGAFGEFTFDVQERSITLGYNERFSDSTYYEYVF